MKITSDVAEPPAASGGGAATGLIAATCALALASLAMALAETSLWTHYLIDAGESISLAGLGVITAAGIYLYRQRRLLPSLPLAPPWLLLPVITQGDQIIDNLSINGMRFVSHVLLGALFGIPVALVVAGARATLAPPTRRSAIPRWLRAVPGIGSIADGRVRRGSALLAAALLVAEMGIAIRFLGWLMLLTLAVLVVVTLIYGFSRSAPGAAARPPQTTERFALVLLLAGVATSAGLFAGFKHRPGAYQGSPSYFMDPAQQNARFDLSRVPVPSASADTLENPEHVRAVLEGYARSLEQLLAGYFILDRNYNYDFHNHLFLRSSPVLPDYRATGLRLVREARARRVRADDEFGAARSSVLPGGALAALLDDVQTYTAFSFARAPILEAMSGEFERTPAGLQHATHLYEGEGKVLGVTLAELLEKHRAVLSVPAFEPATAEFAAVSRSIHAAYADRIVGF